MTISEIAAKHCVPCKGTTPLTEEEAKRLLEGLPEWVQGDGSIQKAFRFKSYLGGLDFAYAVGKIAEEQDHHPDMQVMWRRVKVTLTTHVIEGLSMNDFIMAARSELEYRKNSSC